MKSLILVITDCLLFISTCAMKSSQKLTQQLTTMPEGVCLHVQLLYSHTNIDLKNTLQ